MMTEIGTSIWGIEGNTSGKTVMILGGVHGNERTGIEVVRKLKGFLDQEEISLQSGQVILALGNLRAIEVNERGTSAKDDLNRSFPPNLLERDLRDTYEDKRAHELAPHMRTADIVIDLHATNKPSEPFLACLDSKAHRDIYQWFTCSKVLADPRYILGGSPVTSDEFTEAHGGIGICYETGLSSDLDRVDEVITDILNLLTVQGLIPGEQLDHPSEKDVYEITKAITLDDRGFSYTNGFGKGSWQEFKKGDIIGQHGEQIVKTDSDGVLVFPKLEKHWVTGRPVGYLAKRVS
ncbi:MAG: succinylglutamate desuccinylase/aspartoacylase family protein [bacterium]|jgi:predicted deacylase|nr:succinylglutamate desuccinylase/aspartoacylase family protein [bacterium]